MYAAVSGDVVKDSAGLSGEDAVVQLEISLVNECSRRI
jgi:hypothetical protein